MKKIFFILIAIVFHSWANPAMGQSSSYGSLCKFFNIDKTVKAKIGTGEDAAYLRNMVKAYWPVMINGKECPKLQEKLCNWMTGKEDIKQLDKAIEYMLYTDNESVPFGEGEPYTIIDDFDDEVFSVSSCSNIIELKSLGNRFATFHLVSNIYFAGAAHGMYVHNYMTYDTQLDKIVTLEDVLIDPELIRPFILKSIEIQYQYTAEDLFLPEDNIMPIPSVFYFEDGYLHLFYQVYEIASFVQGYIDVPVYYPNDDKYPEYLTPYGKEVMKESFSQDLE